MSYSSEFLKRPITLFCILRDYVTVKGLQYSPYPRSNIIAYGLVEVFFVPDRIITKANLSAYHASSTSRSVNYCNQSSQPTCHPSMDPKIAHNIASRFEREGRYSGSIGKDISEIIDNYYDAADDYNLTKSRSCDTFTISLMAKVKDSIAPPLLVSKHPSTQRFNGCFKSSIAIRGRIEFESYCRIIACHGFSR